MLVNRAGTTIGYAAVQIALRHGARVVATAGSTHADALRALGAPVTSYGEGMAERVQELAGGPVDLALDTAPISNSLPEVIRTVNEPEDALTLSDFAAAQQLGVRFPFGEDAHQDHNHVLGDYARLAAEGTFAVPVARIFPLEDRRATAELGLSGKPGGKFVLQLA